MSDHAKILKTRKKIASNLAEKTGSNNKAKIVSSIIVSNDYYTATYSDYIPITKKEKGHRND